MEQRGAVIAHYNFCKVVGFPMERYSDNSDLQREVFPQRYALPE